MYTAILIAAAHVAHCRNVQDEREYNRSLVMISSDSNHFSSYVDSFKQKV